MLCLVYNYECAGLNPIVNSLPKACAILLRSLREGTLESVPLSKRAITGCVV